MSKRSTITLVLIAIWAASFTFCLLVPIAARIDIPDLFPEAVKAVFDTFATPLGVILGFAFSEGLARPTAGEGRKKGRAVTPRWVDALAVFVTLLYCGVFDYFMLLFALHRSDIESVITGFSQVRPYIAFLITGMIAFYFGSSKEKRD